MADLQMHAPMEGPQHEIANTSDDLGAQILAEHKAQLLREKKVFEDRIADLVKTKARFKEQWETDKRLVEMQIEGNGIEFVTPERHIHKSPEYWDLQRKKLRYAFEMEKAQAESSLDGFDAQMVAVQEQLDSVLSRMKKVEAEYNDS